MLISPSAKIGGVPIPWKNCGGPDDIISIHAASAGVWPLQRGKSIPITFVGRAARSLTSISGQFKMTFGLIPIVNRIFSEPFPVDAGPFAEQSMVFVPPEVPSGSVFGFHVQAGEDSRRSGVFCVDLIVPVR